jgi:valyl-tRNA synthetase
MNPARHEKLFPMAIRPQSHEIIRTWAFYTIAKAMLHENKIPWKDILISGWILDPDRKKMSKSKGNVVTPMQFIEEHGADAVRYWSGLARYGVDTAFDPGVMKIGRRLVTKIFNASKFVLSNSLNIKPDLSRVTNPLDLAFLQKLQAVAMQAKQQFESYEPAGALQEAERFFWSHFTDTYIELAKGRAQAGEESATQALHFGLNVLLRLFAPFLPYITEEVWSWAYQAKSKSIHLARYPDVSDFSQCGAGKPLLFDTAVSALTAINGQKTLDKVSIARPVVQVTLKARAATFALLEEVARDVWAATKTQKMIPEMNETLEEGVIQVVTIEYGPEPVKT